MKYTKEQLNEKYKMLPKELQDAMFSGEATENVKKIGEKHNLHVDKIGELGEEVWFTMLGVKRSADFIRNIKTRLNLPDEKINMIAKDINEKIFLPVREYMKKTQGVLLEPSVEISTEVVPQQEEEKSVREALKEAGAEPVQSTESEIKPATTYNSDDLRKKEVELENQINHPQLTESEETNVPINTEQEVKPEAPVPANLPVEEEVKKVGQEVGKERHIQKQSPYAKDPYREPIE